MKKCLLILCTYAMAVCIMSGCGESKAVVGDIETTEETTEATTIDEDSLKPEIDYEYAKRLEGYWVFEKQSITFENGDVFYMVDEDGGTSKGNYAVVASSSGIMAISLAVNENDIRVFTGRFRSGDNKLVLKDEVGNETEYTRTDS